MKTLMFVQCLFVGIWLAAMLAAFMWAKRHPKDPELPRRRASEFSRREALRQNM